MGKKGAFIKKDGWSQSEITVYTNTIMEKNKQGEGGRFKDDEFSGVK